MARRGENIYKRRDGRWEGRFVSGRTESGSARYSSVYGKSYSEVKGKLLLAKGHEWTERKDDGSVSLVGERKLQSFIQEWLEHMESYVKDSTYVKYKNTADKRIIPYLGVYRMSELTSEVIEGYIEQLYKFGGKSGKGLSPKTVIDCIAVLRSIFHYIERKYSYSCCSIEQPNFPQRQHAVRVFNRREQKILTQYLCQSMGRRDIGILLSLYAGLRIGELCALQIKDINLDSMTIFVQKTVQRLQMDKVSEGRKTRLVMDEPKSACSIRNVPIPQFLYPLLKRMEGEPDNFFLSGNSEEPVEPRNLQYYFKTVLMKAGIEDANFHTLRHTFATRCVEQGFDVKCLSEILGHSTVNITLNKYVHPSMQIKRDNMEKLSELFTVK